MRSESWISGPREPDAVAREVMREDARKRYEAACEMIADLREQAAIEARECRAMGVTNADIREHYLVLWKRDVAVQEAERDSAYAQWEDTQ